MKMSKHAVRSRGISGLPLDFSDVATTSRKHPGVVTLRHNWQENVDARAWDAIRRAAMRGAQDLADRRGEAVEVYSSEGHMIDQVEPRHRETSHRRTR